jgi:Tol biopolymer transport system component
MPDGSSLVFSSDRTGFQSLWRIPVNGGEPQPLGAGGDGVGFLSVARQGNRLVYQREAFDANIYRIPGPGQEAGRWPRPGSLPTRLVSSFREEIDPQFSPDGKKIAFASSRSGGNQIWVCDSDGSNAVSLTDLPAGVGCGSARWSPDGKQIAFDSMKEGSPYISGVYVVSTEGGTPRLLTSGGYSEVRPSWSRDGRWIYFGSNRSGDWEIWKVPSEGGSAVRVTQKGGREAFESPDGQWLYFTKKPPQQGIWRVPVAGGEEVQELSQGRQGLWAVANPGIFLLNPSVESGATIELFRFATHHRVWLATLAPRDLAFPTDDCVLTVSPDGRWIAFVQQDRIECDLVLVENFR